MLHPRPIAKRLDAQGRTLGLFADYPFKGDYTIKRKGLHRGKVYWSWIIPLNAKGKPVDIKTAAAGLKQLNRLAAPDAEGA
jgi:hypothetical protein